MRTGHEKTTANALAAGGDSRRREKAMRFPWRTQDGEAREAHAWPSDDPRAVVACIHGLSGSGEQFHPLPARMGRYSFFALDLRGQGSDPVAPRRGMTLDLETQLRDIAHFLAALRLTNEGKPLFLMGESMGSLLSVAYAAQTSLPPGGEIDGVLLSVPVVGFRREIPRFLKKTLAFLARHFPQARIAPSRFVNGKSTAPPLTRDTAYQESLLEKPHHLRGFGLGFLAELGELIDTSHRLADRLRHPTLVLSAGNDCFVKPEQISAWFERIPSPDKTHRLYPDAHHLLWHDWDRDHVMADIEDWLDRRSGP